MSIVRITVLLLFMSVFLTVLLAGFFHESEWGRTVHRALGYVCHQDRGASIFGNTLRLPLCLRCTGIYLSLAAGGIFHEFLVRKRKWKVSPVFLAGGSIPIIIDGLTGVFAGSAWLVAGTGIVFGFACGLFIMQGVDSR